MDSAKLIGVPVSRIEDVRLLTGRAQFIDDVRLPGMLEAAVLRSTVPHAWIRSVDVSAASALPGVYGVVTGADVRDVVQARMPVVSLTTPDMFIPETYPLAVDRVRYPGQGVAAVAAKDRATAEDALELIRVEYDELPAVTTLEDALAADAPRLYDELPDNVACRTSVRKGDVDAAFADADVVVSEVFRFARQMGTPLETRGVVVTWDRFTDRLDVWLSTQAPDIAREAFGEVLGLPVDRIRVRTPDVGGGFGNKFDFCADEVVAAVLARRTGRPVKLIEDRAESFQATVHSREQRIEVEISAREDGVITGMRGTVYGVLGGVLGHAGLSPVWTTASVITGPYDIAAVDMNVVGVFTNKTPYGSFRGYGMPKANFVHERMVELLAKRLGVSALDVRRKNLVTQFPYQSPVFVFDTGRYEQCLDLCLQAVAQAGWERLRDEARSRGAAVGIGFSFHNEVSGFGPSRIVNMAGLQHAGFDEEVVRIDSTGHVTVYTGLSSMGQGIHTTLAQVAADSLGVPLEHVTVLSGDTDMGVYTGYGTAASRGAAVGGAAVRNASVRLRGKVLRIAGHILEASPDDLTILEGVISVRGVPGRTVTMAEIGDAAHRRLNGVLPEDESPTLVEREVYDPVNVATSFGCTAVLAEVDRETGVVTLLGYLIAHDCGTVINPSIVDGQLHGGAAQAIGGALSEEIVYGPDGRLLTSGLRDYLLPSASEVPSFGISRMSTPADHVPGGFKGMGEAGVVGGGAAIVTAIEDAVGVNVTSLPITPPRLLTAMQAAAR